MNKNSPSQATTFTTSRKKIELPRHNPSWHYYRQSFVKHHVPAPDDGGCGGSWVEILAKTPFFAWRWLVVTPWHPSKNRPKLPPKGSKRIIFQSIHFQVRNFLLVAGRVHIGRFSASKSIRDQCRFDRLNPSFDRIMAPRFRPVGWKKKPWA